MSNRPKKSDPWANLKPNSEFMKAFLAAPARQAAPPRQNAALRRAVIGASLAARQARTPRTNKPKSPPKKNKSPPRVAGPLPFALPAHIANRAVGHAISPNGKNIAYFLANKPTGRKYMFNNPVPWSNVQAGVRELNVPRR